MPLVLFHLKINNVRIKLEGIILTEKKKNHLHTRTAKSKQPDMQRVFIMKADHL